LAHRDGTCGAGDTQLGPRTKISARILRGRWSTGRYLFQLAPSGAGFFSLRIPEFESALTSSRSTAHRANGLAIPPGDTFLILWAAAWSGDGTPTARRWRVGWSTRVVRQIEIMSR